MISYSHPLPEDLIPEFFSCLMSCIRYYSIGKKTIWESNYHETKLNLLYQYQAFVKQYKNYKDYDYIRISQFYSTLLKTYPNEKEIKDKKLIINMLDEIINSILNSKKNIRNKLSVFIDTYCKCYYPNKQLDEKISNYLIQLYSISSNYHIDSLIDHACTLSPVIKENIDRHKLLCELRDN